MNVLTECQYNRQWIELPCYPICSSRYERHPVDIPGMRQCMPAVKFASRVHVLGYMTVFCKILSTQLIHIYLIIEYTDKLRVHKSHTYFSKYSVLQKQYSLIGFCVQLFNKINNYMIMSNLSLIHFKNLHKLHYIKLVVSQF